MFRIVVRWDASRVLIDVIGNRGWLEVDLAPGVEGRAVTMTARRQWSESQDSVCPFHGSSSAAHERASGKSLMGALASA